MSRIEDLANANLTQRVASLEAEVLDLKRALAELQDWYRSTTNKVCPVCSQALHVEGRHFPNHMRHGPVISAQCPNSFGEVT